MVGRRERENGGVGYSESISSHTVIRTTENSRRDVQSRCMRNESALCMAHVCMWTSQSVDIMCVACYVYATMHNEQRRAHSRGLYVDHPE